MLTKDISFLLALDENPAEEYYETADALAELAKRYKALGTAVWKAEKQLLKFDEINRLTAEEVKPKSSGSSGRSGGTGGKTTTPKKETDVPAEQTGAQEKKVPLPIMFTLKDVLFNWSDLNWEQIFMKLIAGLSALGGAVIGGLVGGVPGAVIGLVAGLSFGILTDSVIFNFDGKLSGEEIRRSLLAVLPVIGGGIAGVVAGGPLGAVIGISLGLMLSFTLAGINGDEVHTGILAFFDELQQGWNTRWESFTRLLSEKWQALKRWWSGLSLGSFPFRLPHLQVAWEELSANSILARYLGITAIPHLSVQWYARGGIVDGATLIGAGEQGREAIIPLERHTEWIRLVAIELKEQLESLSPSDSLLLPDALAAILPPAALQRSESETPDFSGLAETIANAIAALGEREEGEPVIRVYLDGRQLSDAVTKYQRRELRAIGA